MDTLTTPSHRNGRSRSILCSTNKILEKKDYLIGISLLLVVVFLWTSSNFLTQNMFDGGYEKPFLVTYMNTSAFSVYLIPFLIRRVWEGEWSKPNTTVAVERGRRRQVGAEYQPLIDDSISARPELPRTPTFLAETNTVILDQDSTPLTTRETARLSFTFCFFWFVANWSVNASLDYTSVASTTILSSMSGFFTLGIGRLFQVETLTLSKCAAVLTSFCGVFLVALSDSQSAPAPVHPRSDGGVGHTPQLLLGDSLALLSAIFYAFYVVLLKVRIRSESRINMQLFFGFVGLFNILACWPIGIILHLTKIEVFELPTSNKTIAAIVINMLITLSSDYIYVLAMLKTTPLVVTVGLSLTIPLAVIGDLYFAKPVHTLVVVGALLVLVSFVGVGWASSDENPTVSDLSDDSQAQLILREDTI